MHILINRQLYRQAERREYFLLCTAEKEPDDCHLTFYTQPIVLYPRGLAHYTCADALKYRMNENRHTDKCLNSNLPKYVTFCIFADDNHNLRAVVPARNSHENTIALHA